MDLVNLAKRLIRRGEELCARVLCDDVGLDYNKIVNEVKNERNGNPA